MSDIFSIKRRRLLQGALAAGSAGIGSMLSIESRANGKAVINMQLGWLASGGQIGEVVAKRLGFYEQEGIDFRIQPGGPNIDGVPMVASGRFELGQVSSSPSVMMAISQEIPIRCFAVGLQQHPYCFVSLKKTPIRQPKDMVGKKIGIQSTGMILLRALLAKNQIAEKDVQVIPIGSDMSPLLTGQVDAITTWQTNTTALKVLGAERVEMRLWYGWVRLYANPYYATVKTIQTQPEVLQRFVRATARGWNHVNARRDEAVDLLVKEYPNLNRSDERESLDMLLGYVFNKTTQSQGWGAMEAAVWQDQINTYAQLGQFSKGAPKLENVFTMDILKATQAARMTG